MRVTFYHYILHFLLLVLLLNCKKESKILQVETIKVDSLSQIVAIEDSLVRPIIYTQINGLGELPVPKAKQLFISALLPSILISKYHLAEQQRKIHALKEKKKWTSVDSIHYNHLKTDYKANGLENLLLRMRTVPNSIVLGQAALESGWGQSRFFREGNNIFGMWSYNRNEPRLKASRTRENDQIHVRRYDDYLQSIDDYFKTLATARAYRGLREALYETHEVNELLPYLKYYSERRMEYVDQLRKVIEQNNLTQYDQFIIDPQYFVEK